MLEQNEKVDNSFHFKRAVIINRLNRLTHCCTQFKSSGVKILWVLYLHYNVPFTLNDMDIPETKRFSPREFELGTTSSWPIWSTGLYLPVTSGFETISGFDKLLFDILYDVTTVKSTKRTMKFLTSQWKRMKKILAPVAVVCFETTVSYNNLW